MGERDGKKVHQFHYGNSPYELDQVDLKGKTLSINTSSGTQGIVNAYHAPCAIEVISGCFANSYAVEQYIKRAAEAQRGKKPLTVTIVPMGYKGIEPATEDELYALYLRNRLLGKRPTTFKEIRKLILSTPFAEKFNDPKNKDFPKQDLDYCLTPSQYDNVPKVYRTKEGIEMRDALKEESH